MYTPTIAQAKKAYPHFSENPRILAAIAENDRNMTKRTNAEIREIASKYRQWFEDSHGYEYAGHDAETAPASEFEGPQGAFKFMNVPSEKFDEIMKKMKKYKMQLTVTASWNDGNTTRFNGYATKGN